MSYADPQSITINAVPFTLPQIHLKDGQPAYRFEDVDNKITLTASHLYGKRTRRVLRLDHLTKSQLDSYTSTYQDIGGSIYTVFDFPATGSVYSPSMIKTLWDGYDAFLNASSDAAIVKLLNGES